MISFDNIIVLFPSVYRQCDSSLSNKNNEKVSCCAVAEMDNIIVNDCVHYVVCMCVVRAYMHVCMYAK